MTTARTFHTSEGDFQPWQDCDRPCRTRGCEGKVRCRLWESKDGAYEDWQYRCSSGHTWWIDGIDS